MTWISDKEKTYDLSNWLKCHNCDTYVNGEGQMLGRLGRLSVYYIDPTGVWISMTVACPQCIYGGIAHMEYRDDHFYKAPIPFDFEKTQYIPPGLSHGEWRALGICQETGDTYVQAAQRIPSQHKSARAELIQKLEQWESERSPTNANQRP